MTVTLRTVKPNRSAAKCGRAKKRRYATEYEADRAAAHRMALGCETPLRAYPCGLCDGWHLTHQAQTPLGS